MDGLTDLDRSGRPFEISALERHRVVTLPRPDPAEFGHERVLWSHEALAETLLAEGLVCQISRRTVGMILEVADLEPHRVKMWCYSNCSSVAASVVADERIFVPPHPHGLLQDRGGRLRSSG